jgi:lysophospholipase L1-like esterase
MRHILTFILAFVLILPRSQAQPVSITDPDAEAYIFNRNISDPTEIYRLHAWYSGLKNLNIWSSIVLMASYSSRDNALSGSTIVSMVGGNGTINGTVPQTTNGIVFTENTANYVSYANPLQSTALSAYSVFVAFDTEIKNGLSCLIGANDNASANGITLFLNGSPQAGSAAHNVYTYYSSSGAAGGVPGDILSAAGVLQIGALTSGPQTLSFSFSSAQRVITSGFNLPGFSSGSFGTVWNNTATWNIGRMTTASAAYNGDVNLVLVLNRALTIAEHQSLRRLYTKTLGWEYMPRVNMIFEGDSLTAGAVSEWVYSKHLWTNVNYRTVVQTRNHALSAALSSAMLTDYSTSCANARIEFDYAPRQYFHIMAGGNDMSGTTSGYDTFLNLRRLWALAKADGYIVVAYTYPPTFGLTSDPVKEARRQECNYQIRQSGGYDYLIDTEKIQGLQNNGDTAALGSSNPTYQDDRVHFTSYGHKLIADYVAKIINAP